MNSKELKALAKQIAFELMELQKQQRQEEIVGIEDASRITGLSVKTIYNRKQEIGFIKRGRKIYFSTESLEAYNRQREHY